MARPKKDERDRRTHRLPHVRCTEAEGSQIRKQAAALGMSVSDYIRIMALQGRVITGANDNEVVQEKSIDDALVYELHRIGNNLNQLTKKYHIQEIEPQGLRSLFPVLEELLIHIFKRIKL